jgi:putative redox protein
VSFEQAIESGGLRLAAHFARPPRASLGPMPTLVLAHGFPLENGGAAAWDGTHPELADRLARDTGWAVLTFNFRGTGESTGSFSLAGWLDDLAAVCERLHSDPQVGGVWLAGAGLGGSLSICRAAEDLSVRGVATLAAPADAGPWADDPAALLARARELGAVRDPAFPPDFDVWATELAQVQPVSAAAKLPPRPLLVLHGSDDDVVPLTDARVLADAGGESAELRIVTGAGHRLRHDPRAVALLMGWMERQQV